MHYGLIAFCCALICLLVVARHKMRIQQGQYARLSLITADKLLSTVSTDSTGTVSSESVRGPIYEMAIVHLNLAALGSSTLARLNDSERLRPILTRVIGHCENTLAEQPGASGYVTYLKAAL